MQMGGGAHISAPTGRASIPATGRDRLRQPCNLLSLSFSRLPRFLPSNFTQRAKTVPVKARIDRSGCPGASCALVSLCTYARYLLSPSVRTEPDAAL